ncbi:MAG: hypothetical protein ACRETW_02885 [Stenotrophobium sp.]
MKALDWMRYITLAAAPESGSDAPVIHGVLDQYVNWKKFFERGIRAINPEAPETLMSQGWLENCPLGRWLSEVKPGALSNDTLLKALKDEYEQFYLSAMNIVQQAREGNLPGALHDLEHGSHVRHSLRITRLLIDLEIRQSRPDTTLAPSQA